MDSLKSAPVAVALFREEKNSVRLDWLNDALESLFATTELDASRIAELLARTTATVGSASSAVGQSGEAAAIPVSFAVGSDASEAADRHLAAVFSDTRAPEDILHAIQQLDAPFESLVDGLNECIWVLSEGRVAYANAAALNLLRLTWEKLQGGLYIDSVYVDDRPQVSNWLDRVLKGNQLPPFECRISQPNGNTRLVELSGLAFDALDD